MKLLYYITAGNEKMIFLLGERNIQKMAFGGTWKSWVFGLDFLEGDLIKKLKDGIYFCDVHSTKYGGGKLKL